MTAAAAQAENGVLFRGPWSDALAGFVRERWPEAGFAALREDLVRIDLSGAPREACPGYEDGELLATLSKAAPDAVAAGFFCDGAKEVEGVRVYAGGRPQDRRRVRWAEGDPPDPIAWPIGWLSLAVEVPIQAITSVRRPERPAIAVAAEALLLGKRAASSELTYQALELLGHLPMEEATAVLLDHLDAEDWVERFHAVRAYARLPRGHGLEGRPRLDALLEDADEGVRENALKGIGELLPQVSFSDRELHQQIDAAVARGAADEDEDVRAVAEAVAALRAELLG